MADDLRDVDARITDEDIARARRQIGIPQHTSTPPFNAVAAGDTMSHTAIGLAGDDNPLYNDREYGRTTRWRGQIGHPLYMLSLGVREAPPYTPELKALFRGLFRGVGKYYSGSDFEFYRPIYEGDALYSEYVTARIEVKETSSFAGGRSVLDTYRDTYYDKAGIPVGSHELLFVNAERRGSKEAGRFAKLKKQAYTADDIARIDEMYAAETRRGAEPRYWEDVEVGEALPSIVKGPMTMVDIISHHIATGMGRMYNVGPLRLSYQNRQKIRAFYTNDDWGVPQVQMRLHWDDARARDLGLPTSYDYGVMRTAWQSHLLTNWMGDDGWLWKFHTELRGFNFMGDTHIMSGKVVAKRMEGDHPVVDVAVQGVSQRGDNTAPGHATIILPSRQYGPVVLPTPPAELRRRGAVMQAENSARRRGG